MHGLNVVTVVTSGIASAGVADSLIKVSHIARTRRIHQVTAACLYQSYKGTRTRKNTLNHLKGKRSQCHSTTG